MTENDIRSNLDNNQWLADNARIIAKLLPKLPQDLIDELFNVNLFDDYIIAHDLLSEKTKKWLIQNLSAISNKTFHLFIKRADQKTLGLIYDTVYSKKFPIGIKRTFYSVLWDEKHTEFIKETKKIKDFFMFGYKYAEYPVVSKTIIKLIKIYPMLIEEWALLDIETMIRFYSKIGDIVYFPDSLVDKLLSLLYCEEVNQQKLKQLLKGILNHKNCSEIKRAELLYLN